MRRGVVVLCIVLVSLVSFRHNESKETNDRSQPVIILKPIVFDSTRKRLSLEYLLHHYGITRSEPTIQPRMIVIHHTAIDNLDSSFNQMNTSVLPSIRKDIQKGGALDVSAHFLVDRNGTIYQLLPENMLARHTIGLNPIAIGIENVGGHHLPLTNAQVKANAVLVRYLKKKYPAIEYLIGHKEYGGFRSSALWMEKDPDYFTEKNDPAGNFMSLLRSRIKDLHLKNKPW